MPPAIPAAAPIVPVAIDAATCLTTSEAVSRTPLTAGATASPARSRAAAAGPEPLPLVAAARPRLRAFAFVRDAPFAARFDALREAPLVFDAAALPLLP